VSADTGPRDKVGSNGFRLVDGIFVPPEPPLHRGEEYDEAVFSTLLKMQRDHFWYRGRHRLLLRTLQDALKRAGLKSGETSGLDLGGGCGGWLEYLRSREPGIFGELALGDSSMKALEMSAPVVSSFASRYNVDILELPWEGDWDVIFLLDVLEHIPSHLDALREAGKALRPGGLLMITVPALSFFWSYNDEIAGHQRRYSRKEMESLASEAGLKVARSSYFMFLLSPVLMMSRMFSRPSRSASREELRSHLARTHRVPSAPLNGLLYGVFSLETTAGRLMPFPWGTSLLAVLTK